MARVHAYDITDFLRSEGSPPSATPRLSNVLSLAGWGDLLFLGTGDGTVLSWDRAGNQLWSKQLPLDSIPSLAVGAGGTEVLAGGSDGKIYRLDAATGSELRPALAAGSIVRALVVRPSDQDEQLFALIGMNPNRIDSDYFVRMEPFDRGSALRPEDRSQTRNSTTVDNCRRLRSGATFSRLLRHETFVRHDRIRV